MAQSLQTKPAAKKKTGSSKKIKSPFESRLAELNEEQRLGVETIEGPVMMVAGPGTDRSRSDACGQYSKENTDAAGEYSVSDI